MAIFVKFLPAYRNSLRAIAEGMHEIRVPLLFVAGFLFACVLTLVTFWEESSFITVSYHSLSLGMDMDTVEYVIGKPSHVVMGNQIKDYAQEKQTDKNFNSHAFKVWKYSDGVVVSFNHQGKVIKVSCFGNQDQHQCEPLYGLKIGDAEDILIGKLGDDYESKIEDGKKLIFYASLYGQFDLEKRKIIGLELSDFSDVLKK